ncbi:unnamed protein product [Brassica rapa]|uniref:ADP-ribosyl cyclase/cyclic ADP-ribose hydrolase n=2 Tax=Brassica campestris TaxID=3711 RepID=A0A8D9CMA1_BRACM|nr:unnamed protein product [Brassica rapa]
MASSSSSTSRNYSYNVFASFHGPDVRKTLLSHIREQFTHSGITMFDDQEIVRSATIAPSLTEAVRESRISIVIFTKNYASSSWCLNELVEILECKKAMGHIVMTIFYGVDPSDVRKQTGEFGIAFNETCASKTKEEKQRWRQALNEVGNIAGEDFLRWSNEAKMIKKISRDVSNKLNATPSRDFDGMVGLEPHLREMESLLDFDDDGVKVVAIFGPAGIGKTTIARAVHSLHSYRFQLTCFVDNLRVSHPISFDEYGLKLRLQEEFLSNILKQDGIRICHLGVIEERLHDQRVLVILDDVNNIKQLEALAGDISWFGPGSRVVVTTENKDLLHQHGINNTYHVGFPSTGEALEILCRYAFRNSYPHDGFQELALKVTDLCGNLPLGLCVVGSSLRGKKEDEWEDVMKRLESVLDRDIEEVLRVGYESLDENEQTLFLHIAVFFNYENGNLVKTMFADSDLDVKNGLKVLENRSLIELYNKKETINMHRLLQQVGIKAIHKQEPWKRRILIDAPEICDVLELAKGTRFVSGISFDISDVDEVSISPSAFKRMPKLRFLRVYKSKEGGNDVVHIPEEMELPRSLRLLEWKAYPNKYLPPTFHPEYLVKLDMQGSQLEYLWQGTQPLTNLKEIDLQRSFHLKELPDLSNATNLKGLYLSYCQSLVELPPSCSSLDKLKDLWMDHCTNLQVIPAHMKLASLKRVSMKGCSRLRHIPLMSTNIRQMDISETAVEDVPASTSICARPMIYSMIGCQRLKEITHLPLYVTELDLRKSSVEKIPDCIKDLCLLLKLKISGCRKLTSLPELPSQLMLLSANDCESLEEVASPFHNPNANMSFTNCFRLRQQAIIQQWFCLGSAFLPGRQVPPEFDHRARGCSLTLPQSACTRFKVCLVLLPNNQIKEDRSSQLLCRRVVNGDVANSDDKSFYFNISRCRAEHLFIFPSGLFEEDEGLPDEVHREIVFEFSSKYNDFDVVECGAKFLTDENSYESESDQAATTIASFMGAMNVDPTPIIASLMRYESMMAEQSDERATVQLFIVNVDNQPTTSCCRNISSLVSSVYSRY